MKLINFGSGLHIAIMLAVLVGSACAQGLTYKSKLLSKPPVLDGEIDSDPAWESLPWESNFSYIGSERVATKQTFFKVGYTPTTLYFAIKCEEPNMNKIVAKFKDRESVFNDDGIELFIFPAKTKQFFHLIMNTQGARWNGMGLAMASDTLWDWQMMVAKQKNSYTVEIMLPFKLFDRIPDDLEQWTINISRNTFTTSEDHYSTWSQLDNLVEFTKLGGKLVFTESVKNTPQFQEIKKEILGQRKKQALDILGIAQVLINQSLDICNKNNMNLDFVKSFNKSIAKAKQDVQNADKLASTSVVLENAQKLYRQSELIKADILLRSFCIEGTTFDGM